MIVAVVPAAAFAVSLPAGKEAVKGWLAAVIISGFAGCISSAPVVYAAAYKHGSLPVYALAASVIRLLLMSAGSITILAFANVGIVWFAVWIGVFYLIRLALEVRYVVRMANGNGAVGAGKV